MRRLMTSTLAVIFAVGTISGVHTSAQACSVNNVTRIAVCEGTADIDAKRNAINKINEIENNMQNETKDVQAELDKKRSAFSKSLKNNGVLAKERENMKAKFYSDNKKLINKLDEMRKPYIEEMKKVHKNYVDSLF